MSRIRTTVTDRGQDQGADPIKLLIVDDDRLSANLLRANVARPGSIDVAVALSGDEALGMLSAGRVSAVLTDIEMPRMDGVELIRRIRASDPDLPVIALSGHALLERAVEAMRAGATDFLQKPVNATVLMALVERAIDERPVRQEIRLLNRRRADANPGWLIGTHPALEEVRRFVTRVAGAPFARILITGESGTGKSLLARGIHDLTGGKGLFTHVNCAALPPQLLEAELFGYEKGAFTDARELKRGLIEAADGGTLFLDEIDTLPVELQAKLLVYLETHEIRRVGGVTSIRVRTRVMTASAADLHAKAEEGAFRRDLLYRLDVASVRMPSLREMPEVVPELMERFLVELCEDLGRVVPEIAPGEAGRLQGYSWPGNARELRNALERALIFQDEGPLRIPLPTHGRPATGLPATGVAIPLGLTMEEVERRYISATLAENEAAQGQIATSLGISRKTLWEKRRRYGV
jgi:DNA-binding NtrC family response regulator